MDIELFKFGGPTVTNWQLPDPCKFQWLQIDFSLYEYNVHYEYNVLHFSIVHISHPTIDEQKFPDGLANLNDKPQKSTQLASIFK